MGRISARVAFLLLAAVATPAFGQGGEGQEEKTLSPYFLIKDGDSVTDLLPLKETSADVKIAGVTAEVKVVQTYRNEGLKPIEAVYIFPAGTRAAVHAMKMTIGERTIVAKIEKREQARREYEQARSEGKSASLLEQQRPNVFQMNVANIMPGDVIRVEMVYNELLVPTEGVYEFVYPTAVGPRYSNMPSAGAPDTEKWVSNPYLGQGEPPGYKFDLAVELKAGMPISELLSSSHDVDVDWIGEDSARIKPANGDKGGGNRDFILRYRLSGKKINTGLILHKGAKENFFVLMAQPPAGNAVSAVLPREYIFIMDVSGSMHGYPIEISKKLMENLVSSLRPTDLFNVLLFSGGNTLFSERSLPATGGNVREALDMISRQRGGGGTELLQALERALSVPKQQGFSRTVVIATDGYVHVEAKAFDLIRSKLGEANMFAFGIGTAVNRFLIEGIARAGMGEPFVVTRQDQAEKAAERFRRYVQTPLLTKVRAEFEGFNAYDVEPSAIPDVLAERPVILMGKWSGEARGKVKVRGLTASGGYMTSIDVTDAVVKAGLNNEALPYLWARHRVAELGDYEAFGHNDERAEEIARLGLNYNLLTAYTSFVAVDSQVRNKGGRQETVKQPLPLPEGVSNYAVGNSMAGIWTMGAGTVGLGSRGGSKSGLLRLTPLGGHGGGSGGVYGCGSIAESGSVGIGAIGTRGRGGEGAVSQASQGELSILGGLDKESVARVIQAHRNELRYCYERRLIDRPDIKGTMTITFTIDASGRVTNVKIKESTLNDGLLEYCIRGKVKTWKFPHPKGGGVVTVTYKMKFGDGR